jgi:hypothetical protein
LAALSQLKFDGQLSLDGTMTFRRTLPDEEIFESLAARLRPLLVPGESVFHKKAFKALSALIRKLLGGPGGPGVAEP